MEQEKRSLQISRRSFLTALAIIFLLMLAVYLLSFLLPGGEYERAVNAYGQTVVDPQGEYREVPGGLPFWKWLLSPLLVLGAEGSGALIAVILFLLVIGGVFNALTEHGLMHYMLGRLVSRYGAVRYRLMAVLVLFFMAMGSLLGSFEEVVPLVPIVVSLAAALGWDSVTGLGMSLLATGCGFAAGLTNPFTIGVAQTLAGLPLYSGLWLRLLSFWLIYALLLAFLRRHARAVAREPEGFTAEGSFDAGMARGLRLFALTLGAGIALVFASGFLPFLRDYTMVIVALTFLIAGVAACLAAGMGGKALRASFLRGVAAIAPSVLMILMAASIRYTMTEAHILDSVLHAAVTAAGGMPKAVLVLFVYLICLVMNFFIPSGSAKAFLLIPLIVPLGNLFGVSAQLCVLAFAYGDGFSNVFYPTNPALLISLGLAETGYAEWARFSGKFQAMNLLLTALLLLFGLAVGYA